MEHAQIRVAATENKDIGEGFFHLAFYAAIIVFIRVVHSSVINRSKALVGIGTT